MRVIELGKCWKCGELYPKAMRAYVCWKCGACAATGRCHYCGAEIHSSDEACPKCGKVNGWALPDEGECWNCHLPLVPGAKYCTSCGLAVGTIALKPYPALIRIYGAMSVDEREHRCTNCNFAWESVLSEEKDKYCPQCGSPVEQSLIQKTRQSLEQARRRLKAMGKRDKF